MKYFIIATNFACAVISQAAGHAIILPPCGQACIGNMLSLSTALGCPLFNREPVPECLCGKPDFGYGIRDCANESCSPEHAVDTINYGLKYCHGAVSASANHTPIPAAATAMATAVIDVVSTFTSGNSIITTTIKNVALVVATTAGVSENHDYAEAASWSSSASLRGLVNSNYNDNSSTLPSSTTTLSPKTNVAATSTVVEEESSSSSTSSVSQGGGVAPMVTGALNSFARAPIVVAAAAVMIL